MKRQLGSIKKIVRIIFWALRFRIYRLFYFVSAYLAIERSGLFDAEFYRKIVSIADPKGIDLLAHYIAKGAKDEKDPHALFDTKFYSENNPEVIKSGLNPLFHFIECGLINGLSPHPLFDTAYYLKEYPDVSAAGINPLIHYLACGAKDGKKPNPLFDTAYYLMKNVDVADSGINPLVHYVIYGARDGRNPSPLFDSAYYLKKNPEIAQTDANPLVHYLRQGAWEKRNPHPLFQSDYYLMKNADVADSGINPLVHYIESGARNGRKPNHLFDSAYYIKENPDVAASGVNPLSHYIEEGWKLGNNPSPLFDMDYYARMYPDVVESGINPLVHYLEFGIREDRYPTNLYYFWIQHHCLTTEDKARIVSEIKNLPNKPFFSIIVPVFNDSEQWLRKCIESILAQLYPHWEICIADDASTMPHVRQVLEEYASCDPRIRVVFREVNGHISSCSNTALELATGEFIALLDHDDELSEDALYENAILLNAHPDTDMIYSDEDKINEEGERFDPFFKPDWSPDTFLSQMYTCHLGVYRTTLVRKIGGFREGFEGSQDYDLVLRLTEQTNKIRHIPKILYHWRSIPASSAASFQTKGYAQDAGLRAIREALQRRGEDAQVEPVSGLSGRYLVRYRLRGRPQVSIILPTRDLSELLETCLKSVFDNAAYELFDVIIIDNDSRESNTHELFRRWQQKEPSRFRVIPLNIPFNYPALINEGVRNAGGDLILLLNNDIEIVSENWIYDMAAQAMRPKVGAVGVKLLYPDDTIQHAGVVLGVGGIAGHSHKYFTNDHHGYFDRLRITVNCAAVTGACLMIKKDRFLEAGGFDEALPVAFNDIDFCIRLLKAGYYNICLSHLKIYHHESKTRGPDDTVEKQIRFQVETKLMKERWGDFLKNDPFYNPNLTRRREDFTINLEGVDS